MPNAIISPVLHDDSKLVSFREAMGWLRCSRSSIYRLMWKGKLTGYKLDDGTRWFFYEQDLRGLLVPKDLRTPNIARSA